MNSLRRTVTSLLLVATVAWPCTLLAGATTSAAPASPEKSAATPTPADLEVLSLLEEGRVLMQCGLADYSSTMYQAALKRTAEPQSAHLHLRAACETAISLFKTDKAAEGATLVAPFRDTLSRGDDADTRCLRDLALGYAALAAQKPNEADDAVLEATREAQTKATVARQGDCHLLQAAIHLARKKYPEAAEAARAAIRPYTSAGLPLSVAEADHFLARVLTESNDAAGAGQAEAQALAAVTSLAQGPYLDPSQTAGKLAEIVAGHRAAADKKTYPEAFNGALSLLILAHNRTKFANRPEIAASEDLNEHTLLAYLALYDRLRGKPAPAAEFLTLADTGLDKEASHRAIGETQWLAARYERGAGNQDKALLRLDQADAALANQTAAVPAYLTMGVAETRALCLAAKSDAAGATKSLQAAVAAAKAGSLQADQTRLEGYLADVEHGNLSIGPDAVQASVPVEAVRQAARLALLTQPKVAVFRSPFVSDYPQGTVTPAVDVVSEAQKNHLPRPTPPPVGAISPEERIRLGGMLFTEEGHVGEVVDPEQFRKAIPDLLQILAREGDSVKRLDQLGICYSAIGKWQEAADTYDRILKLDPKNGPALQRRDDAKARMQAKKPE